MDLSTTYMGLSLKHPVVPSAGPLSRTTEPIEKLAEAGAAAIVLESLFEEQVKFEEEELDHFLTRGTMRFAESLDYYPPQESFNLGPDRYLDHIRAAKAAVDVPVIASLNGISAGGWVEYAKDIEQAGADALELNVYYIPTHTEWDANHIESMHAAVLEAVKMVVRIPVAMKLSPYFSATAGMLARLDRAGADALVLFNRFYQPVIDVNALEVRPDITLSTAYESRLPIRWAAIMFGKVDCSLAVTSGIGSAEGVVQAIMAGADVTQVCSVLLREGHGKIADLVTGLGQWMEEHDYESVRQMKGILSQQECPQPAVFERANYMKALTAYRWPGVDRVM